MDAKSLAVSPSLTMAAPAVTALPAPDVEIGSWEAPYHRLLPLWRHAVWLGVFFALSAIAVGVRLDVQRTRIELDRNSSMQKEAGVLHERLQLEYDARRRAVAMESAAAQLALSANAPIVVVGSGQ